MVEIFGQKNPENKNPFEKASGRMDESKRAWQYLERENREKDRLSTLSPEDQKRSASLQQDIKSLLSNPRENLVKINTIVRDSSQRLLLPPALLKEVFEVLRKIHAEEIKNDLDRGDTAAIKGFVVEELNQVSQGYNELFKNLQWHIETLPPLDPEAENIIYLQDEVRSAEKSVKQLLKNINSVSQVPGPLAQSIPPETMQQDDRDDGSLVIN